MSHPSENRIAPLVGRLGGWAELDAADRDALLALPYRLKRLDRHEYVLREGDPATHVCLLLSGFAMRNKFVAGGERQILSLHMRGDPVDLQNALLGVADHNVQMLTPGEAAFIPRDAIRHLAFERPAVGKALWFDTLVDASVFREWIANIGRRDSLARIAHLLCEFALRLERAGLGEANAFELPLTHEQIADCTALTEVHVNRTLKELSAARLIQRRGRTLLIWDWDRLAEAGDFDSAYLHLQPGDPAF